MKLNELVNLLCSTCDMVKTHRLDGDSYYCQDCGSFTCAWNNASHKLFAPPTRVRSIPPLIFHKMPVNCQNDDNVHCQNAATRVVVIGSHIVGYCDSCMLDRVIQSETVKVVR